MDIVKKEKPEYTGLFLYLNDFSLCFYSSLFILKLSLCSIYWHYDSFFAYNIIIFLTKEANLLCLKKRS